ncbi:hypothetical protein U1Q18_039763 [Sarracenia purpurea var. burkii]
MSQTRFWTTFFVFALATGHHTSPLITSATPPGVPLVSIHGNDKKRRWLHQRATVMAPPTSDGVGATTDGRRI